MTWIPSFWSCFNFLILDSWSLERRKFILVRLYASIPKLGFGTIGLQVSIFFCSYSASTCSSLLISFLSINRLYFFFHLEIPFTLSCSPNKSVYTVLTLFCTTFKKIHHVYLQIISSCSICLSMKV